MTRTLHAIFQAHPADVDETYGQHMRFALGFALHLFLASLAALIHAVLPCCFEKTASRMIKDMNARLITR